jgi:hypothetical protein
MHFIWCTYNIDECICVPRFSTFLQTVISLTIVQFQSKHAVEYKNTNHQQMHKESFIVNCNTLLHVSTLLSHLQEELFVIVTLRLHFIVE